jgi:hypothetical protein
MWPPRFSPAGYHMIITFRRLSQCLLPYICMQCTCQAWLQLGWRAHASMRFTQPGGRRMTSMHHIAARCVLYSPTTHRGYTWHQLLARLPCTSCWYCTTLHSLSETHFFKHSSRLTPTCVRRSLHAMTGASGMGAPCEAHLSLAHVRWVTGLQTPPLQRLTRLGARCIDSLGCTSRHNYSWPCPALPANHRAALPSQRQVWREMA